MGVQMTGLRTMSNQELSRFEVLHRVVDRRLTQQQAAQILGLNRRQIYRLLQAINRLISDPGRMIDLAIETAA